MARYCKMRQVNERTGKILWQCASEQRIAEDNGQRMLMKLRAEIAFAAEGNVAILTKSVFLQEKCTGMNLCLRQLLLQETAQAVGKNLLMDDEDSCRSGSDGLGKSFVKHHRDKGCRKFCTDGLDGLRVFLLQVAGGGKAAWRDDEEFFEACGLTEVIELVKKADRTCICFRSFQQMAQISLRFW